MLRNVLISGRLHIRPNLTFLIIFCFAVSDAFYRCTVYSAIRDFGVFKDEQIPILAGCASFNTQRWGKIRYRAARDVMLAGCEGEGR